MIHYHGGPITPLNVAASVWTSRHAFISFERPDQVAFAAEVCQSFALDNGAFSVWKQGGQLDVPGYAAWVNEWRRHPGFDFALIPDAIDGSEADQDRLFAEYRNVGGDLLADVPVWHLHESLARLGRLCRTFPRVALGSSGQWSDVATVSWWERMAEAMAYICDADGRPPCKLHGLRMLNPAVFSRSRSPRPTPRTSPAITAASGSSTASPTRWAPSPSSIGSSATPAPRAGASMSSRNPSSS